MTLDDVVERLKENRQDKQAQKALYEELLPKFASWYDKQGFKSYEEEKSGNSSISAEDLAHDAIFKIIAKIKQCRHEPIKWMWTVAKNIAKDRWRAEKASAHALKEVALRLEREPTDDLGDPIEKCVSLGLTSFQKEEGGERAAVIAWRIDNVSPKDIASRIGRSYDATRQYIMQSMKKFKPYVMHCFDRFGEES